MPNWCENSLLVIGGREELNSFYETGLELDDNKTETWSIKPYHPYPGEWDYDWCIDNWGTKWDVDDPQWELKDNQFSVSFLSAWGPPAEWLRKVQQDYPKLKFELEYNENGMQFRGKAYTVYQDKRVGIYDEELPWINQYGGKVKFYDIEWDSPKEDLPCEITMDVKEIDDDFSELGADLLSVEYDSNVKSFCYEISHRNEVDI